MLQKNKIKSAPVGDFSSLGDTTQTGQKLTCSGIISEINPNNGNLWDWVF